MRTAKMTTLLFLALLGTAMGFTLAFEHDWNAVPNLFFGAMFFSMFLNLVPRGQETTDGK